MKRIIFTTLVLMAMLSLNAQTTETIETPQKIYRNQLLIAPFYFFDATYMMSYEYLISTNGALRITPSVTLSNVDKESSLFNSYRNKEGYGIDLGYKIFLLRKGDGKVNVYIGPYAMYKYVKFIYSKEDHTYDFVKNKIDDYNVFGLGVDAGIKFIFGHFVLDLTVGGGIRYPQFENDDNYTASSIFDDYYKGITPRANLMLGVAF